MLYYPPGVWTPETVFCLWRKEMEKKRFTRYNYFERLVFHPIFHFTWVQLLCFPTAHYIPWNPFNPIYWSRLSTRPPPHPYAIIVKESNNSNFRTTVLLVIIDIRERLIFSGRSQLAITLSSIYVASLEKKIFKIITEFMELTWT